MVHFRSSCFRSFMFGSYDDNSAYGFLAYTSSYEEADSQRNKKRCNIADCNQILLVSVENYLTVLGSTVFKQPVFEDTSGINNKYTTVQFTNEVLKTPLSLGMLGAEKTNMVAEKNLRGILRSQVDRSLSQDSIIIVGSLNNIKRYRYDYGALQDSGIRYYAFLLYRSRPMQRLE